MSGANWRFKLALAKQAYQPHHHLLLLQMKRLKWCCRENAAGALYKIITREELLNVSQNCGRIEMSSAGVWMERGMKQFEKMVVDLAQL